MTETIAIVNEKGGTGKTTTAVNLSAALGELGRKVLLVDLDGQAASSRWLGVEDDTRFADALWSGGAFEPIAEAMPGVWLAPGSGKLDSVAHDLRPTQGGQLRKVLAQLGGFDHIIIDCPPSLGNRLIGNAILAATHAIVPVEASILALDGLKILLTTFQDVRDGFGHDIILRGVLACRYDARTRLSRLVLAELNRSLPGRVFHTVIRENIRMRECPGSGKSILLYAPDSHAAEDYRGLAKELLAAPSEADQRAAAGDDSDAQFTDEERQAILDIRGKTSAMLRATEPRVARRPAVETPSAALDPVEDANPETAAETAAPASANDAEDASDAPAATVESPESLDARDALAPAAPASDSASSSESVSESVLESAPEPATQEQLAPAQESPLPAPQADSEETPQEPAAPTPAAAQPSVPVDSLAPMPPEEPAELLAQMLAGEPGAIPAQAEEPVAQEPIRIPHVARPPSGVRGLNNAQPRAAVPPTNSYSGRLQAAAELPQETETSDPSPPAPAESPTQEPQAVPRPTPIDVQPEQFNAPSGQPESPAAASVFAAGEQGGAEDGPPKKKDDIAALRAILDSIKKQDEPAQSQDDAKQGPIWRRFFTKRSA